MHYDTKREIKKENLSSVSDKNLIYELKRQFDYIDF